MLAGENWRISPVTGHNGTSSGSTTLSAQSVHNSGHFLNRTVLQRGYETVYAGDLRCVGCNNILHGGSCRYEDSMKSMTQSKYESSSKVARIYFLWNRYLLLVFTFGDCINWLNSLSTDPVAIWRLNR